MTRSGSGRRGQALAEFALVFPIAMIVIFGIIVFGLYVFTQQQIQNVAREAARHAAIHSSTSLCPTASWKEPQAPLATYPEYPFHCDGPNHPADALPWPKMHAHARSYGWGLNPNAIHINACWSGHVRPTSPSGTQADFPSVEDISGTTVVNVFVPCTIGGIDPIDNTSSLGCTSRMTTPSDDPASDIPGNQVTVYACYRWTPPLAGLFGLPSTITLRAVVTEIIQRQQ